MAPEAQQYITPRRSGRMRGVRARIDSFTWLQVFFALHYTEEDMPPLSKMRYKRFTAGTGVIMLKVCHECDAKGPGWLKIDSRGSDGRDGDVVIDGQTWEQCFIEAGIYEPGSPDKPLPDYRTVKLQRYVSRAATIILKPVLKSEEGA